MLKPSLTEVDIFIKHGFVIPVTGPADLIADGAVAIDGGKIVAVGSTDELSRAYTGRKVIDARSKAVLPGLINAHCHFLQDFMKGAQDDLPLVRWIEKVSFPRIRVAVQDYFAGRPELQSYATLHGCIDALRSGITTVLNMEWATLPEVIKVYEDTGIRAMHTLTFTDNDQWTPPEAIIPHDEIFALAEALEQRCKASQEGLASFWYGIACPNSCSSALIREIRERSQQNGVPIHIHLAETEFEFNNIRKLHNNTPTGYLQDLGLWGPDVLAAHGIWLTEQDMAILRQAGTSVTHNPECNMKIASGVAPIAKMLEQGIDVALGTDSCAVKDNMDLFETMRIAVFLQRVTSLNSTALSSYQALEMATLGGARALGLGERLGSLEAGKMADVILVDLRSTAMRPINNLINNIVYCANAAKVADVIVNGRLVVEDYRLLTVDEEAAVKEAELFAYERYRRAGVELPPYFVLENYVGE